MNRRLVVVLGYSNGGRSLHAICAARLRRAEAEARPGDVVLLSGWARHARARSEAELMAQAWRGPRVELVLAPDARTTIGNARVAARVATEVDAAEVVLVTSRWHERRAAKLFRAAFRGTDVRLTLTAADGPRAHGARLRELACWTTVPLQAALTRRARAPSDTMSVVVEREKMTEL
jgi:uncharacterized SAM-binding protein YcdF (DUF218 family)